MNIYCTPRQGQTCTFQILFTSDVHGAFRDYSYTLDRETPEAGFSKVVTLMRKEKEDFDGTTFMVDIGDIIQGNGTGPLVKPDKFGGDWHPFPLLAAYDAAGYDIVSLGNHEFNFGIPALMNAFEGFKGEKLCCNVFDSSKRLLKGFNAYKVKTLDNGLRVAFIGVVTPNVDIWDKANLSGYTAISAAEATRRVIGHIKERDLADVFVVLGHMHVDNELNRPGSGAADVVAVNPEIDVFLGAHFHTAVGGRNDQNALLGTVKFAENLDSAKSYGRVRVKATYTDGRWRVLKTFGDYNDSDVKTDIVTVASFTSAENDPAVVTATEAAHQFIQRYLRETVAGYLTGGPLVPSPEIEGTNEAVLRPTPLIHLIGKIMLKGTEADIAAVSLNSYNSNCLKGKITLGNIALMYVYDNNTVYKLEMTGKQVKQWMEWSYAFFGTPVNGKPDPQHAAVDLETDLTIPYGTRQVYLHDKFEGLSYEVDLTKPVGERICNITLTKDGSALDDKTVYTVATTNYRATSCLLMHSDDGVFPDPNEAVANIMEMDVRSSGGNINMLDWIEEYIVGQDNQTITNEVEENWRFINLDWDKELRKKAIDLIRCGKLVYDFTKPVKKSDLQSL